MTRDEWKKLLQTYSTADEAVKWSLDGIVDHLETPCNRGQTEMIPTPQASKRGLPPFSQVLITCDRGTRGCNLQHRDLEALIFARLAMERTQELLATDPEPMD